jgi:hypothetical protein
MSECNCRPKLERLSLGLPLAEYKMREQLDIPAHCPIHSISGTYVHRFGGEWCESINPLMRRESLTADYS